jgi:hypothetical protein
MTGMRNGEQCERKRRARKIEPRRRNGGQRRYFGPSGLHLVHLNSMMPVAWFDRAGMYNAAVTKKLRREARIWRKINGPRQIRRFSAMFAPG